MEKCVVHSERIAEVGLHFDVSEVWPASMTTSCAPPT